MGKPTCAFCGKSPDGIHRDIACCRRCAHTAVPQLVARAFVGASPDAEMTVIYQSLLTAFSEAYWREIAVIIAELKANREARVTA